MQRGSFSVQADLPPKFARGGYQLIAHAVGNSEYSESWSDPEITVYSGTNVQLTGPTAVSVDTLVRFAGRLTGDVDGDLANREVQVSVDAQAAQSVFTGRRRKFRVLCTSLSKLASTRFRRSLLKRISCWATKPALP